MALICTTHRQRPYNRDCNSCVNPVVYAYRVREFRQTSPRLCCLNERIEVERGDGENTTPTFQAYNNQVMETKL